MYLSENLPLMCLFAQEFLNFSRGCFSLAFCFLKIKSGRHIKWFSVCNELPTVCGVDLPLRWCGACTLIAESLLRAKLWTVKIL